MVLHLWRGENVKQVDCVMPEDMFYSIERKIIAQIVNMSDRACVEAIYKWAERNGIDEVRLCDERKLREVLKLGFSEYQRLYGD